MTPNYQSFKVELALMNLQHNFISQLTCCFYNQEVHSPFAFISVPKVFKHLSRTRVLTMEWMIGESPTDLLSLSTENSVGNVSVQLDWQRVEAKRRLLDLVCEHK